MKKVILFLVLVSILITVPANVFAAQPVRLMDSEAQYQYFDDGSYLVTKLDVVVLDEIATRGAEPESYNLQAKQSVEYYDAYNNLDWVVTITAIFLVCPTCAQSGMCQSSELSAKIYDTSWGMYNVDERCLSNNAYGACSMKNKILGITTKTVQIELTLTCDRYGNVTVLGQ